MEFARAIMCERTDYVEIMGKDESVVENYRKMVIDSCGVITMFGTGKDRPVQI